MCFCKRESSPFTELRKRYFKSCESPTYTASFPKCNLNNNNHLLDDVSLFRKPGINKEIINYTIKWRVI